MLLNIFPFGMLPLRLSNACRFLFYFYGGYVAYSNRYKLNNLITPRRTAIMWSVFVILFIIFRPLREYLPREDGMSFFQLILRTAVDKGGQLIYATVGIVAFYCTCTLISSKKRLSSRVVNLASTSFGIYLFQQFILQIGYYKTSFPLVVGPYWLPWCGFVIAVGLSYIFSFWLLRTKVGRSLIG